ncbi:MAG: hypothetical protein CSA68_02865 [Rhodobacterales bacterium]|nr:MAG: hypothetical protein CSA68_02865 [Rhodobacterales bacterium]
MVCPVFGSAPRTQPASLIAALDIPTDAVFGKCTKRLRMMESLQELDRHRPEALRSYLSMDYDTTHKTPKAKI